MSVRRRRRTWSWPVVAGVAVGALSVVALAHSGTQPASRLLVFATNGDGTRGELAIATVRPDGRGFRKLTSGEGPAWSPRWTRDGRHIVFWTFNELAKSELAAEQNWRMRPDGTKWRRLPYGEVSPRGDLVWAGDRVLTLDGRTRNKLRWGLRRSWEGIVDVVWSPDGRYIAASVYGETATDEFEEILVTRSDGGSVARAVVSRRPGQKAWAYSWSPDGKRLLVELNEYWYSIRADGTGKTRLARVPDPRDSASAWSPDSRMVAYVTSGAILGVSSQGGPTRRLVSIRSRGRQTREVYVAWSSRGELAFSDNDGIYVARPGSRARRVSRLRGEPAWSRDGGRLVFSAEKDLTSDVAVASGEIFVVDRLGHGLRRLTTTQWSDEPQLSPNGTQIAFTRDVERPDLGPSDDSTVYVMSATGIRERRLGLGHGPRWSPDGRSIACVRNRRVVVLDLARGVASTLSLGREPAWSPDGERLAFVRYHDGEDERDTWSELFIARRDGSQRRELDPSTERLRISRPVWSPDGSTIAALVAYAGSEETDGVWLLNASTGAARTLLRGNYTAFEWSPDGIQAAFVRQLSYDEERLGVVAVRTGAVRYLAPASPDYESIAWSTDGVEIGFVRSGREVDSVPDGYDVWAVRADGSQLRRLTRTAGLERSLDW